VPGLEGGAVFGLLWTDRLVSYSIL
jgi:hypothetical protein